jgi:spermidine synthase
VQTAGGRELRRESAYNVIFVRQRGACASLSFRRRSIDYLESLSNLADATELPVPYTRTMTLGLAYAREQRSILAVGLGAGTLPGYLASHLPDARIVAVELDPVVVELARGHFGLRRFEPAPLSIETADGRIFLYRDRRRYDLILLDAFRGGYIPEHLTTREFYQLAKSRLRPGGVVVSNLHYGTAFFDSSVLTLRDVFARVDLYNARGNVIAVSADELPTRDVVAEASDALTAHYRLRYALRPMLQSAMQYATPRGTRLLTDDFSPANLFESIESANRTRP